MLCCPIDVDMQCVTTEVENMFVSPVFVDCTVGEYCLGRYLNFEPDADMSVIMTVRKTTHHQSEFACASLTTERLSRFCRQMQVGTGPALYPRRHSRCLKR